MALESIHPAVRAFLDASPKEMIVGGKKVKSISGKTYTSINPSDGTKLTEICSGDQADIDRAVEAARAAMEGPWGRMLPGEREKILRRFAELIEKHSEQLAQLESLDNGKSLNHTRMIDSKVAANNMYHFAGWPSKIFGQTVPVSMPEMFVYTRRDAVGIVGLIIPWNYPLIHGTQKISPALAAGNAIILKPASVASLAMLYLGELGLEAGLPAGALNVVTGPGGVIGQALSSHPGINKIQITGSTAVGKQIIQNSAVNIKRLTLELGSKAPNCIFEDANIEAAIAGAFKAAFVNSGQSCVAGCRLYVQKPVYERVVAGLLEIAGKTRMGHAFDSDVDLGPIVDESQYNTITGYIKDGRESGAKLLTGGERLSPPNVPAGGFYLPPTIFTNVADDARISKEEIFGPVVNVYSFETEEELVRRANNTTYGLAAGIWTTNLARAHRVASKIEAGVVWVNTYDFFAPNAPFGGYKQSGYGRDNSFEAIESVTEVKTIWVPTRQ
ncbi:MAG: aldehyde dehydrogenase family protein [Anaerolineaceae bacterium]|nr:aldehyde dehydrogenase family protein [Anaerolineaceae bacterium]